MSFTRTFFLICFLLVLFASRGQNNLNGFWQPSVSLNYKVAANYSHNFSLINRNYLFRKNEKILKVRQFDIAHFSLLKIQDNQSMGLGLQFRLRNAFETDESNELRLMQQYNIRIKARVVRWGMRWRSEQRILNASTIYRLRSRLAADLPLSGEALNPGEPYLIASTENLISLQKECRPQYDQRFSITCGFVLSNVTKIQTGIEYRFEDFFNNTRQLIFLNSAVIISL